MKWKISIHLSIIFYLFIVRVYFIFRWPKIKPFDPLDITILEFNDCNHDISHEFEIIESKIQNESNSEEERESILKIFEQYKEKHKSNLEKIEIINIGTKTEVKEIKISVHLNKKQRKEMIEFLTIFLDVFVWSYDDIPEISIDIVVHRLTTNPNFKLQFKFYTIVRLEIEIEI